LKRKNVERRDEERPYKRVKMGRLRLSRGSASRKRQEE
jgi:hypothetical protein